MASPPDSGATDDVLPPEEGRRRRRRRRPKRPRRRLRDRFDLKKAMFVLPNMFTVASIFCGFYAIVLCMDAPSPEDVRRAALSIFIGMFCDMFDGRVARLTRTQSEFGMQLDSLADVCSFGFAPGILLYRWALEDLGFIGLFAAFTYAACGALRLARFNVIAMHDKSGGAGTYFVGLPIPLAAGAVVAAVLATYPYDRGAAGEILLPLGERMGGVALVPSLALVGTFVVALLMVSTVRYRTFKKVRPSMISLSIIFVTALSFLLVALVTKPAIGLSLVFIVYIAEGLFEHAIRVARRIDAPEPAPVPPAAPAASTTPGSPAPPAEPHPHE
jgi:CDP-diacylglycerol--serine O-phosphatidyltransferase